MLQLHLDYNYGNYRNVASELVGRASKTSKPLIAGHGVGNNWFLALKARYYNDA